MAIMRNSMIRNLAFGLLLIMGAVAQSAYGGDVVNAGWDLFATDPSSTFMGMNFQGVPIGSYDFGGAIGVQGTGTTDTIMQRLSKTDLGITSTDVVMNALQLETTAPVNFGGNGLDDYYLTLQSTHAGPASTGSMTVFGPTGPTIDTESFDMTVYFDIRKGSLSGPIVMSSNFGLLGPSDGWSHTAPLDTVLINGANYQTSGGSTNQGDFWPNTPLAETANSDIGPFFVLQNPHVPEPSSLMLAGTAALIVCGVSWRGRKRAIA